MTDLIQRLAEIREQAGYDPLPDPTVIEGAPLPPPTAKPDEFDEDDFPEETIEAPMPPPSPLHRLGRPTPQVSEEQAPVPVLDHQVLIAQWLNSAALTVRDNAAVYKGRPVELNDKDISAISKVVLVALKRQVQNQLAEVEALLPRRKRRKATGNAIADTNEAPVAPPRRRGRPKKVQS